MELREFIEQRIAEDEAAALAACGGPKRPEARVAFGGHWHVDPWYDGTRERCDLNAGVGGWLTNSGALEVAVGEHAARHDPARVLREVASCRKLLELADYLMGWSAEHVATVTEPEIKSMRFAGREILRQMVSRWSDHPDYDPSWSPAA